MEKKVEDSENLFRAIRPDDMFWKNEEKTKLSSAAFKDRNGLSVDRQGTRTEEESIQKIKNSFTGKIAYTAAGVCYSNGIMVDYCPTEENLYHCEIIRNHEKKLLSKSQAKFLADCFKICG
mgnify:CR=1 FL=1